MKKKMYNKSKFGFFYNTENDNDVINSDHYYYNHELKFCRNFPFIKKVIVEYKFVNNHWIEQ